ncbi:hypothetical protein OIN60_21980 [Paenibacillus sp. P96]|uniref:BclA C-terminal domain-containing protein n=1 Tax=Paenibacillus zeirhizosphaerae TaxID=2987519 RepID=A0ABT9FXH4_9BACL|nr:hypothetical protein [Paenibacillus sp. P96]MDP4099390.1 hypothetical protein [Paenibacillus sp. P96]
MTANNLVAGITSAAIPEIVPAGGIVSIDTFKQNGTAITNTNGNITLAANQTYSVVYKANVGSQGVSMGVSTGLFLNGSIIPGTNSAGTVGSNVNDSFALSGNTIITTDSTADILTLRNTSGATELFGASSISVIKLA